MLPIALRILPGHRGILPISTATSTNVDDRPGKLGGHRARIDSAIRVYGADFGRLLHFYLYLAGTLADQEGLPGTIRAVHTSK